MCLLSFVSKKKKKKKKNEDSLAFWISDTIQLSLLVDKSQCCIMYRQTILLRHAKNLSVLMIL